MSAPPPTCDAIRSSAAGLASLAVDDPERVAAEAHAAACAGCVEALAQGRRTVTLLDALPAPPAPSPATMARVIAAIQAEARAETEAEARAAAAPAPSATTNPHLSGGAAPAIWAAPMAARIALPLSVLASWGALLAVGHHNGPGSLVPAVAFALLAAIAGAAAVSAVGPVIVAVPVASLAFALGAGHSDVLAPALGVHCVATEVGTAVLPIVVAIGLGRRRLLGPDRRRAVGAVAAAGGAGALAGHAALHLLCAAATGTPHLLVFHVGGVLLATALGAMAARFGLGALSRQGARS